VNGLELCRNWLVGGLGQPKRWDEGLCWSKTHKQIAPDLIQCAIKDTANNGSARLGGCARDRFSGFAATFNYLEGRVLERLYIGVSGDHLRKLSDLGLMFPKQAMLGQGFAS
jgi:hypothetical protein